MKLPTKKQSHTETTTVSTPAPAVDVPEFSIQYRDSKPEHIIMRPVWSLSNGTYFRDDEGVRIFNCLRDHYPELKSWRALSDYTLSTYHNITGTVASLSEVIALVGITQTVITNMLSDWLYYRDMVAAHKDR